MPNHVENYVSLNGDEQKIREMLETIKNDDYGIGTIDFNKIIPMPESLNIDSGTRTDRGLKAYKGFIEVYTFGKNAEDARESLKDIPVKSEELFLEKRTDIDRKEWELGKTAWQNMQDYGAPTWYEWCCNNWGTKWNAYGYSEGLDYSEDHELYMQTAWSAPHAIMQKLSEMFPDITFEHQWADEDIGYNCGRYTYSGGERIEEYFPETRKEAIEFACKVWDYDVAELGLCLNSTETDYINTELDDYELAEIFGRPMLFTNERLKAEDIPKGMYCYDLRENPEDGTLCSVEPTVRKFHAGSIIAVEPIDFKGQSHILFTEETSPNFIGETLTLSQYMNGEFEQEQTQGGMQL